MEAFSQSKDISQQLKEAKRRERRKKKTPPHIPAANLAPLSIQIEYENAVHKEHPMFKNVQTMIIFFLQKMNMSKKILATKYLPNLSLIIPRTRFPNICPTE